MAKQRRATNVRPPLRGIDGGNSGKSLIRRVFEAWCGEGDGALDLSVTTVLSEDDEEYATAVAERLRQRA